MVTVSGEAHVVPLTAPLSVIDAVRSLLREADPA